MKMRVTIVLEKDYTQAELMERYGTTDPTALVHVIQGEFAEKKAEIEAEAPGEITGFKVDVL